jgi:hypothetical protein
MAPATALTITQVCVHTLPYRVDSTSRVDRAVAFTRQASTARRPRNTLSVNSSSATNIMDTATKASASVTLVSPGHTATSTHAKISPAASTGLAPRGSAFATVDLLGPAATTRSAALTVASTALAKAKSAPAIKATQAIVVRRRRLRAMRAKQPNAATTASATSRAMSANASARQVGPNLPLT